MDKIRPIDINKIFREPIDVLIILLGGIQAPLLCFDVLISRLEEFHFMTDLDSSVRGQLHIPKKYWFDITENSERRRSVIINGCQSIANLAFEKLKLQPKLYDQCKKTTEVRFLGHLRNAGAHGNKFWFKNPSGNLIDPGVIVWSGKTIDVSLHEKQNVFPDFFSPGDFFHLFDDISKRLQ